MNDWKIGLDKWLTSSPDDKFGNYIESVIEKIDDKIYNRFEDLFDYSSLVDMVIDNLSNKEKTVQQSVKIIERGVFLLLKKYVIRLSDNNNVFVCKNAIPNNNDSFMVRTIDKKHEGLIIFNDKDSALEFVAKSNFRNLEVIRFEEIL